MRHEKSRLASLIFAGVAVVSMAAALGAEDKRKPSGAGEMRLPTFPQKFDVQGQVPASFGFAVTQPGPIAVTVKGEGAPVVVTLQGQLPQPVSQQGSGEVRLDYTVTPQDVQKGMLWAVQVRLVQPDGRAAGIVNVQSPPADVNAVRAQATSMLEQKRAARGRPDPEGDARMAAAFQEHKAKFEQSQQRNIEMARAQAMPAIEQIRSRIPSQEEEQIKSRGLNPDQMGTIKQPIGEAPAQRIARTPMPPAAPPPVPVITSINVSQGQPQQPVIITGTGFGPQAADVLFALSPNQGYQGHVAGWSDTLIVVDVPDQSGLLPFDGKLWVSTPAGNSNQVAFHFVPAQETRLLNKTADLVLAPPSGSSGDDHVWHGPNNFWEWWVGHSGNDVLFPSSRLKNGWTVQSVYINDPNPGVKGMWVQDFRPNTDTPFMNVRWWYDSFNEIRYNFGVYIAGPKGVPDGLLVP